MAFWMPVSVSVSAPRLAVSLLPLRSTTTATGLKAKVARSTPPPPIRVFLPGAAVEHIAAGAAIEGIVAAQAFEQIVAGEAGQVVTGSGAGDARRC